MYLYQKGSNSGNNRKVTISNPLSTLTYHSAHLTATRSGLYQRMIYSISIQSIKSLRCYQNRKITPHANNEEQVKITQKSRKNQIPLALEFQASIASRTTFSFCFPPPENKSHIPSICLPATSMAFIRVEISLSCPSCPAKCSRRPAGFSKER